jgi:extracellular elastinolytic metalloproteinase
MDVRSRWRVIAPVFLLLLAAALPSAGYAVGEIREAYGEGLTDFDTRTGQVQPSAAQRRAAKGLGAAVTWNRNGTPATLLAKRGSLAVGLRGDAVTAARSFLRAHRGLFRLHSVAGIRHERTTRLGRYGRAVEFSQRIGGLPAPEALVTIALRNAKTGWRVVFVSGSLTGDPTLASGARISARDAVFRAARSVGDASSLADVQRLRTRGSWSVMSLQGVPGQQRARLIATPTARGTIPAYQTLIVGMVTGTESAYELIVDARSGRILSRQSLVDNLADNPRWKVFPAYPRIGGNQYPWNYPSDDIRELWCWTPGPGCAEAQSDHSPHPFAPWDTQGTGPGAMIPTFTTDGNNNRAAESWDGGPGIAPEVPPNDRGFYLPGPTQYQPTSPTREYAYPWTNVWFETLCDPANYTGPAPGKNDIEAASVNLFAMHNRMHDWSFHLGFNEQRWNGQDVNFTPGTAAGDNLIGDVQEAARSGGAPGQYGARDNANMLTLPDGTPSITNMYLWQPLAGAFYAPCVDGDYDQAVIGHEFGHMIENRMIGKGVRRQGHHAGAMGESFGDLNGMEYLNEYGYVPISGENRYSVGAYVTSNKYRAIRNYGMNFPYAGGIPQPGRYPFVDALNFSDMGYDIVGQQVHANGEIWSATNFDIRRALIRKYGRRHQVECADGKRPVDQCPGNRRWIQLYYDAMVLMPVGPTMLDARNAILAADLARFAGANQRELWWAFATRGFGQSSVTTSNQDAQPKPGFDSPVSPNATVTFRAFAREEGNAPIPANIYVGHYEARVSPIADTNAATAGTPVAGQADPNNLDDVALFAPRLYEFVANAPGYGFLRFRAAFRPGESRTIRLYFATNWASKAKGAVATGDGTRQDSLIDDTENTNWESSGVPVEGRQVTVALSGGAHRLDRAAVSGYLVPTVGDNEVATATQNRFTALRQFELRGCRSGETSANPTCLGTNPAGWQVIYRSSKRFFPGDTPRPVAPELLLRGFDVSSAWKWGHGGGGRGNKRFTHVQLVVLTNQCTGNAAFQGEQDNDPANPTDCRVGNIPAALPPRDKDVRAAELQVYSSGHKVKGAWLADDDEHGHDD